MPFERFKERNAGRGPLESAYEALFPYGILGRRGLDEERDLTNELVARVAADDELEGLDGLIAAAQRPLTREQHGKVRAALAQAVSDQRTINAGVADFQAQQEALRRNALGPNDEEQLGVMDSQMTYAHRLLLSSNPELQAEGRARAGKVLDAQQAYATQNEAQRLAKDASDEAARRAMGEQAWQRYQSVNDDARIESAPFLEQRAAIGRITALFAAEPTAATDLSLIFNYMKLLDPGSVVRESEFAQAQNLAGVPDIIITARNRIVQNRERLTPTEREEFYEAGQSLFKQAQSEQMERNSRYLERARNGGVPENWLDDLVFPIDAPALESPNFGSPHLENPNALGQAAREAGSGIADTGGQVVRGILGLDDEYTDASGAVFRRVDRGNGRYEWQLKHAAPIRPAVSGVIQRPVNE